jgi:hypothetical protein
MFLNQLCRKKKVAEIHHHSIPILTVIPIGSRTCRFVLTGAAMMCIISTQPQVIIIVITLDTDIEVRPEMLLFCFL